MVRLFQEATATPCNTAALIFCAKNFLGMTDQPQVVVNVQQNAVTALVSRKNGSCSTSATCKSLLRANPMRPQQSRLASSPPPKAM